MQESAPNFIISRLRGRRISSSMPGLHFVSEDEPVWAQVQDLFTIGPACDNEEAIEKMIHAGMRVARLNFS